MKYHSQNLNDNGSMFWHGRAWLRRFHWEWMFGKHAKGFAVTASIGGGDSDADLSLHVCIPFLFSIWFIIANVYRTKETRTGVAIHHDAIWFYPLTYDNDSGENDPWWRKYYSWHFPWSYDWYSTEIMEHLSNGPHLCAVLIERRGFRVDWNDKEKAKAGVSRTYDYQYRLNSGEVQQRKATVYVNRMTWRMRWWPLLPFKKVSTSIDVNFDDEVGEGTGSWKGGCIGCGYEMNPGESPLQCLRRMESERQFRR